ncbi:MAG: heme exporter protein CcmD [Methylococcaceae bacterium]|nr:heme exporter protein CcmD [Methylococcaceae bacterium]
MGYFNSFSEFLDMGGHALYVWLSYAITLGIFILNLLSLWFKKRAFFKLAKRQTKREQRSL